MTTASADVAQLSAQTCLDDRQKPHGAAAEHGTAATRKDRDTRDLIEVYTGKEGKNERIFMEFQQDKLLDKLHQWSEPLKTTKADFLLAYPDRQRQLSSRLRSRPDTTPPGPWVCEVRNEEADLLFTYQFPPECNDSARTAITAVVHTLNEWLEHGPHPVSSYSAGTFDNFLWTAMRQHSLFTPGTLELPAISSLMMQDLSGSVITEVTYIDQESCSVKVCSFNVVVRPQDTRHELEQLDATFSGENYYRYVRRRSPTRETAT